MHFGVRIVRALFPALFVAIFYAPALLAQTPTEDADDERMRQLASRFTQPAEPSPSSFDESRPLGSRVAAGRDDGEAEPVGRTDESWALSAITALGIVIGLIFLLRAGFTRLSGRPIVAGHHPSVQVLARSALGPRSHLMLVRVGQRVLAVGESGNGLTTLADLSDPDEVADVLRNFAASQPASISRSFSQLMSRFNGQYNESDSAVEEGRDELEHEADRARDEVSGLLSRLKTMSRGAAIFLALMLIPVATASAQDASADAARSNSSERVDLTNPVSILQNAGAALPLGGEDTPEGAPVERRGLSASLSIIALLTILSLAPALLVMTTSFTRIVIVLSLLRQAMGTQSLPPSQVIVGLSMFLTFLVMGPTFDRINDEAIVPLTNNEIDQFTAWSIAKAPMREFMFEQIEYAGNWADLYMVLNYRGVDTSQPEQITYADVDMLTLIPAFMLSELKISFLMGFRLYLPFLIIDMVIASVLISMGMLMLPPVLISLPFKLLMFVLVDGWQLVAGNLLNSFSVPTMLAVAGG